MATYWKVCMRGIANVCPGGADVHFEQNVSSRRKMPVHGSPSDLLRASAEQQLLNKIRRKIGQLEEEVAAAAALQRAVRCDLLAKSPEATQY